ncbi:hypothetical protein LJC03_00170 [Methanobrevibacter sp. OttesenSCG-928-I08]|nr:hypothetical protein [Methanobrevibacter sp. OttesenSCG-928-I08]
MGFCKDCKHYGLVDDYYRGGRWENGCTLTGEETGDTFSCDRFEPNYL